MRRILWVSKKDPTPEQLEKLRQRFGESFVFTFLEVSDVHIIKRWFAEGTYLCVLAPAGMIAQLESLGFTSKQIEAVA